MLDLIPWFGAQPMEEVIAGRVLLHASAQRRGAAPGFSCTYMTNHAFALIPPTLESA